MGQFVNNLRFEPALDEVVLALLGTCKAEARIVVTKKLHSAGALRSGRSRSTSQPSSRESSVVSRSDASLQTFVPVELPAGCYSWTAKGATAFMYTV